MSETGGSGGRYRARDVLIGAGIAEDLGGYSIGHAASVCAVGRRVGVFFFPPPSSPVALFGDLIVLAQNDKKKGGTDVVPRVDIPLPLAIASKARQKQSRKSRAVDHVGVRLVYLYGSGCQP